jgi:hypothetical protein
MTVQKEGVIDIVAHDKSGVWDVVMVEERQWDGSAQQLQQLKNKVELYLEYALDGPMDQGFPDSKGKPKRIRLFCASLPTGPTAQFVDRLKRFAATYGVGFDVQLIKDTPS